MSSELTITCPQCKAEIKLTESLAAPFIESTRREYQQLLSKKDAEAAKREQAVKDREALLEKAKATLDQQVAEKLVHERAKIAAREAGLARQKETLEQDLARTLEQERVRIATEESAKAKRALSVDLEQKQRELAELQGVLKSRDEKLAEAQRAQADLLRKQRELDDAKRELELTVEKRVSDAVGQVRDKAKQEAEEHLHLKVKEKEETISAMQRQIEELRRKAEQGSQQLQGEVLEMQIESLLAARFPHDRIDPVPKGEHGGDILQRVMMPTGAACGTILWESKRTKNWSDGWLAKLREDQRAAKAEMAVLVSAVLPRGVESFEFVEGIWVVHPRVVLPISMALRTTLIEVKCAKQASEGQDTKMELIYNYITGPKFRLRMQAIVERFTEMQDDLQKEKKAITKIWAKRDEQLNGMLMAASGMVGELQGIAGKSLKEIEGLELKMLEGAPGGLEFTSA